MTTVPSTGPAAEPLRFAYWLPNVSGGLVTSTIEQRTDWSFDYQGGNSSADKKGMWADSSFEDLVQFNDGFLHYHEEIERFGRDVLPIVRALEVEAGLDPAAVPDPAAGLSAAGPVLVGAR